MTAAEFLSFYPQFSALPEPVLTDFVRSANDRFEYMDSDTEHARRLFTAHKLTLYARTSAASGASAEALSSAGDNSMITGKHVGELSVSYGSRGNAGGDSDLSLTTYGIQLNSLLRIHGYSRYVP